MKKFLSIITLSAVLAIVMVSCKQNPMGSVTPTVDTAGLAQFQAWKAMNARIEAEKLLAATTPAPVAVRKSKSSSNSGAMNTASTNNAKTAKKGWSKAAKYSAIGGGTGIVLGAIINKRNRVAGGIIGGVLGGGLGYGIGRSKDKKEGRVD